MSEPKKCPFCGGSGEFRWPSYFLYKAEIEIPQICFNANSSLCLRCCEPECDLAQGKFSATKQEKLA
jgi:hypothetical protein